MARLGLGGLGGEHRVGVKVRVRARVSRGLSWVVNHQRPKLQVKSPSRTP